MISYLNGLILFKNTSSVVLDVNGVGYSVFLNERNLRTLGLNTPQALHIVPHIREDHFDLYGFLSIEDKLFFNRLTSVSGVGPKVGLKIMSDLSVSEIASAILTDNLHTLTQISGVGKKMAERLVLELKDKLADFGLVKGHEIVSSQMAVTEDTELFLALKSLGYSQEEIKRAYLKLAKTINPDDPVQKNIKLMLKAL